MGRINKVLIWQFAITIAIVGILYAGFSSEFALAALYGGASASVMSILLKAMIESMSDRLARAQQLNKGLWMLLFIPRLILVVAFFSYGIGLLRLEPLPMVVTFSVVYLVYWMDWKFSSEEQTRQT